MRTVERGAVIDLRDALDPVVALVDPHPEARAQAIERHRLARVIAFALLVVLNLLDIVSTTAFLERGLHEGNPLAEHLITEGWIGYAKAGLLLLLGIRILNSRPRLATTCALWFVTGIYMTVVLVNLAAIAVAT